MRGLGQSPSGSCLPSVCYWIARLKKNLITCVSAGFANGEGVLIVISPDVCKLSISNFLKIILKKITSQKFSPLHSKPASGEIYFDLSNELGQKNQSSHFIIQNGILGPSKSELFSQIPKVYVRVNVEDESKISQQEFENIFHEAGHAVHTILGIYYINLIFKSCSENAYAHWWFALCDWFI